jgi:hypothetical protein
MRRFLMIAGLVLTLSNVGMGIAYACTCTDTGGGGCTATGQGATCVHTTGGCVCTDGNTPPIEGGPES